MTTPDLTHPNPTRPDPTRPDPTPRLMADAAAILAGWPRLRARLHAVHVPGPDGRCRACTSQMHRAPRWPCAIATLTTLPSTGR